ncbi:hypothetical protein GQ457_13G003650 [Hibiscus cannabinus]
MALHETLRTVCLNSDWTYSVFWTIHPRRRVNGGNGCKVGDDNDSFNYLFFTVTIVVIQAGHGLLQLGSCKTIPEDLHFVLRMRHAFESLGYRSGFYVSQMFSSNKIGSSLSTVPSNHSAILNWPQPPSVFGWNQKPLPPSAQMVASPRYQNPARLRFPQAKDETNMFLMPHSSEARMGDMINEQESDIKWPNGLTFFDALTGRSEDATGT